MHHSVGSVKERGVEKGSKDIVHHSVGCVKERDVLCSARPTLVQF